MSFDVDDPNIATAAAEQAPLIEARQLVKHYGSTQAVAGVSFAVSRGEVVGFLGPNGAGKSTTMKMLTGFLRPTEGVARIAGYDMSYAAKEAQRHIGYLPENAPLYDDMMVVDFLTFIADLRGIEGARRKSQLRAVVEQCGLGDVLGKDIGELSKGFRQRVGLAQALLDDPDLLILDEPTSGLDPNQIVEIRALIRDLGRDKTVLLSTHILSEVQAVCSRAIIISAGRLVADAAPSALGAAQGERLVVQATFVRPGELPETAKLHEALMGIAGVQSVAEGNVARTGEAAFVVEAISGPGDVRADIFAVAMAHNHVLVDLHRHEATLEETFQRLTRSKAQAGGRHAA